MPSAELLNVMNANTGKITYFLCTCSFQLEFDCTTWRISSYCIKTQLWRSDPQPHFSGWALQRCVAVKQACHIFCGVAMLFWDHTMMSTLRWWTPLQIFLLFLENSLCIISDTLSCCGRAWPWKDIAAAQREGGWTSLLPTLVTPKQNPFFCEGAPHLQFHPCPLPNLQPLFSCAGTPRGDLQVSALALRQHPAQQYPAGPLQMCCCKPFTSTAAVGECLAIAASAMIDMEIGELKLSVCWTHANTSLSQTHSHMQS